MAVQATVPSYGLSLSVDAEKLGSLATKQKD